VAINALNASADLDAVLPGDLRLSARAGASGADIDDNIAFPYGCGSLTTFCSDGSYDLYDFRSSGERRRVTDAIVSLSGGGRGLGAAHRWTAGAEHFRRAVDMSSWIYEKVGTGNVFGPDPVVSPAAAGAPVARRTVDHDQRSVFLRDAATRGRWTLSAGARLTLARESDYDASTGAETARRRATRVLPEASLLYAFPSASLYASYAEGLELGGSAPSGTGNAGAVMPARVARQAEAGAKARVGPGLLLTLAVFRAEKPYEFTDSANEYVQRGREVHDGIEASAAGRAAPWLNLQAGAAYLRAVQRGTGEPGWDGQAVPNVPRAQAAFFADADLPLPGAGLFAGWRFSSSKAVLASGGPRLPSWQVFDAGARWAREVAGARLSARLSVDNVFDARYWRDASQQYLFTGLPREARLTVALEY
jgi:iron complex outermembrane receptor protein